MSYLEALRIQEECDDACVVLTRALDDLAAGNITKRELQKIRDRYVALAEELEARLAAIS